MLESLHVSMDSRISGVLQTCRHTLIFRVTVDQLEQNTEILSRRFRLESC